MSGKMDWRKAGLAGKPTFSVKDEADIRSGDAAARYIERAPKWYKPEQRKKQKRHKGWAELKLEAFIGSRGVKIGKATVDLEHLRYLCCQIFEVPMGDAPTMAMAIEHLGVDRRRKLAAKNLKRVMAVSGKPVNRKSPVDMLPV